MDKKTQIFKLLQKEGTLEPSDDQSLKISADTHTIYSNPESLKRVLDYFFKNEIQINEINKMDEINLNELLEKLEPVSHKLPINKSINFHTIDSKDPIQRKKTDILGDLVKIAGQEKRSKYNNDELQFSGPNKPRLKLTLVASLLLALITVPFFQKSATISHDSKNREKIAKKPEGSLAKTKTNTTKKTTSVPPSPVKKQSQSSRFKRQLSNLPKPMPRPTPPPVHAKKRLPSSNEETKQKFVQSKTMDDNGTYDNNTIEKEPLLNNDTQHQAYEEDNTINDESIRIEPEPYHEEQFEKDGTDTYENDYQEEKLPEEEYPEDPPPLEDY